MLRVFQEKVKILAGEVFEGYAVKNLLYRAISGRMVGLFCRAFSKRGVKAGVGSMLQGVRAMYKVFKGQVAGLEMAGDLAAPPTKWWNHLYLALWGWKTIVVLEVSEEVAKAGYRVGYRSFFGRVMLGEGVLHARRFRMQIGHEPCTFFAVDAAGHEVPLLLVERTTKNNPVYAGLPLP
ncbi:hypothetical protein KBD13_01460 [Patescibacteria group bacterium]|nr:hypothetical protein [Patescibacteria group bacterium]